MRSRSTNYSVLIQYLVLYSLTKENKLYIESELLFAMKQIMRNYK